MTRAVGVIYLQKEKVFGACVIRVLNLKSIKIYRKKNVSGAKTLCHHHERSGPINLKT